MKVVLRNCSTWKYSAKSRRQHHISQRRIYIYIEDNIKIKIYYQCELKWISALFLVSKIAPLDSCA